MGIHVFRFGGILLANDIAWNNISTLQKSENKKGSQPKLFHEFRNEKQCLVPSGAMSWNPKLQEPECILEIANLFISTIGSLNTTS